MELSQGRLSPSDNSQTSTNSLKQYNISIPIVFNFRYSLQIEYSPQLPLSQQPTACPARTQSVHQYHQLNPFAAAAAPGLTDWRQTAAAASVHSVPELRRRQLGALGRVLSLWHRRRSRGRTPRAAAARLRQTVPRTGTLKLRLGLLFSMNFFRASMVGRYGGTDVALVTV